MRVEKKKNERNVALIRRKTVDFSRDWNLSPYKKFSFRIFWLFSSRKRGEFEKTNDAVLNGEKLWSEKHTNDLNAFICSKQFIETSTFTTEFNCDELIAENQISSFNDIHKVERINRPIHSTLIEYVVLPVITCYGKTTNGVELTFEK